jgi:uncharacterized protein (TIGR02145 family)
MKRILTVIMICGVINGYTQNTPPHAASTNTWVIEGNGISQTWSDHINVPACDKTDFDGGFFNDIDENDYEVGYSDIQYGGNPKADCRNNPGYYYLYSWWYVSKNAATLCPSPWRVPTADDFLALYKALGGTDDWSKDEALIEKYINSWGGVYGGIAKDTSLIYTGSIAQYWSSTGGCCLAWWMSVNKNNGVICSAAASAVFYGYQVRCVKNEQ